jgi:manganese oxidase
MHLVRSTLVAALFATLSVAPATATGQEVSGASSHAATDPGPHIRRYFIAADTVEWNYTPRGRDLAGIPRIEGEGRALATRWDSAGVIYDKILYREYTDGTFATRKPRPAEWEHLGLLGPLIRAEVGDTIEVLFRNNSRIRWSSMHPHGLLYDKASEGAFYADGRGTPALRPDMVPPGGTHRYVWRVPASAGPAHGDTSSVIWMYHGHYIEAQDLNSGLIGPIIVSASGATKADGTPRDVDREFVTAFAIFDETQSWLFETNAAKQRPFAQPYLRSVPESRKPYLIYSINGLIEGNLPPLVMRKGERVRWYVFANSNDEDVHAPHWHGQTALANHMRTDTLALVPMGMVVADMLADNVGTWLFHCHMNEHFTAGMHALFTVTP